MCECEVREFRSVFVFGYELIVRVEIWKIHELEILNIKKITKTVNFSIYFTLL
jgi:hypothetical protein